MEEVSDLSNLRGEDFPIPFNYTDIAKIWNRVSDIELSLKCLPYIPIMFFGIFGNLVVVYVTLRQKSVRTCTGYFICNMAVADFLTTSVSSWQVLVTTSFQKFILGKGFCEVQSFIQATFLFASIFSLMIISFDRLLAVMRPFSRLITETRAFVLIVVIWLLAVGLAAPLLYLKVFVRTTWLDYVDITCPERNGTGRRGYWIVVMVFVFYVPLTFMTTVYVAILSRLEKFEKRLLVKEHPTKVKNKRKLVTMFFIYLLSYFICWLPFECLLIYREIMLKKKESFSDFAANYLIFGAHIMAYANSAINPIIYGLRNENFQRAFNKTFPWFCKPSRINPQQSTNGDRNEPSAILMNVVPIGSPRLSIAVIGAPMFRRSGGDTGDTSKNKSNKKGLQRIGTVTTDTNIAPSGYSRSCSRQINALSR